MNLDYSFNKVSPRVQYIYSLGIIIGMSCVMCFIVLLSWDIMYLFDDINNQLGFFVL